MKKRILLVSFLALIPLSFAFGLEEAKFDSEKLFPTWGKPEAEIVQGVIGSNQDGGTTVNGQKTDKLAAGYIPRIINIILKFVAPIVVVMFVIAGARFIYAGGSDEELEKSKRFFTYAAIGLGFIILSYSVMKALYYFTTVG